MTAPTSPEDVAGHVVDLVGGRADAQVRVTHLTDGLARFANSRIHQHVGEDTLAVDLHLARDGRAASVSTRRITEEGLAAAIDTALDHVAAAPVDPALPPLAEHTTITPWRHVRDSTRNATPDDRADVVDGFVRAGGDGTDAAGYCETRHVRFAYANSRGHRASDETTLAVLDGIHRIGTAAGMGHQAAAGLDAIDGAAAGRVAVDVAARSTEADDLAPATLPVVLGPEAVATIAIFLGLYGFNAKAVAEGRSFVRLDEQQFDAAFSLRDDVTHDRATGLAVDHEGTPRGRTDLVVDGRSVSLAHDRRTAAAAGTTSTGHHVPGSETMGPLPTDLVVEPGTASVDDLVAGVEDGLYVTAFNYCRVLDPRTLVVTGLTRNGTFRIRDGRLDRPVTNLRFTQSFVDALGPGRLLGVGSDDRHADCEFGAGMVIAPSLALSAWQVTGGASG